MFDRIFGRAPVIENDTAQWLVEVYSWALENFTADVFYQDTDLIRPSNDYFPGRESSVQGMATLIFDKVVEYAGMQYWPLRLVHQPECSVGEPPVISISGPTRGARSEGSISCSTGELPVAYDPALINNPEGLISNFAQALAYYLGQSGGEPPGGWENWPQITEVLAVFMGFGLMLSNSAFSFNVNKCASCRPHAPDRQNYLNQYDVTYALAIFCVLKGIPAKKVSPDLKKSLRGFFRKAVVEVSEREDVRTLMRIERVEGSESN